MTPQRTAGCPPDILQLLFGASPGAILSDPGRPAEERLQYATYRQITPRYLNDAYVWAGVLRDADYEGNKAVELGPGRSLVLDLALAILGFSGRLMKIDVTPWPSEGGIAFRKDFEVVFLGIDILQRFDRGPIGSLMAMNHLVDDLFMHHWATANGIDFFGEVIDHPAKSRAAWADAMADHWLYEPALMAAAEGLARRSPPGTLVVSKNYPSLYETTYRLVERVNFTFELTYRFMDVFRKHGFAAVELNLHSVPGAAGSKMPGSFIALRKR